MTERRNWFGPKRFGYGYGPRSWQGWLSILGFAVLLAVGMMVLKFLVGDMPHPWPGLIALAWTAVCTGLFFWLIEGHTEGKTPWFIDYFHLDRFGARWVIVNAMWQPKPRRQYQTPMNAPHRDRVRDR